MGWGPQLKTPLETPAARALFTSQRHQSGPELELLLPLLVGNLGSFITLRV